VGRGLLFVDADDVLDRSYVASMATALSRHSFVCSRWEVQAVNPPWTWLLRPSSQQEGPMMWNYSFLPYAGAGSIGIRKDVFETVGGFDESLLSGEDIDLSWRVQLRQGVALAFVPEAVVHVRYKSSLRAMFSQARRWGRAEAGIYKRYRPLGVPRIPLSKSLRRWKVLPGRSLRHSAGRAYWATELGNRIGRIEGSVACRTFML
jgi:GT2 family glycosyltransferase